MSQLNREQLKDLAGFCAEIGTCERRLVDMMEGILYNTPEQIQNKRRWIHSMYAQMTDVKREVKK